MRALVYARKTGGRFNEKGALIYPDVDKEAAFEALAGELPEDALVGVDPGMRPMYWMDWALGRPVGIAPLPRLGRPLRHTHFVLDTRFASALAATALVREFAVQAYGPFLVADLRAARTPLAANALRPRSPTLLERLFVTATQSRYEVTRDPYLRWELALHFGDRATKPPAVPPGSGDDLRIAHNLAVARGDTALAAELEKRLFADADRRIARQFTHGVELLGRRFEPGADRLTLYFRTTAELGADFPFGIVSEVLDAPRWSTTPRDPLLRDTGLPCPIPTSLWRPGFIYAATTEILRRPGRERYLGAFRGPGAPEPEGGPPEVELLALE